MDTQVRTPKDEVPCSKVIPAQGYRTVIDDQEEMEEDDWLGNPEKAPLQCQFVHYEPQKKSPMTQRLRVDKVTIYRIVYI